MLFFYLFNLVISIDSIHILPVFLNRWCLIQVLISTILRSLQKIYHPIVFPCSSYHLPTLSPFIETSWKPACLCLCLDNLLWIPLSIRSYCSTGVYFLCRQVVRQLGACVEVVCINRVPFADKVLCQVYYSLHA